MGKQTNQKLLFRSVMRDVLKDLWVAAAVAISISFLGFIIAKTQYTPTYTSSTTFVVSQKGSSNRAYTNMTKTREMVDTFRTVMNSQMMYKRINEAMGVDSLPGTLVVEAVPETNLLTVSVTANRPDTAFRMLKTVLAIYPEVGDKVLGEVIMDVFEKPQYPASSDYGFSGMHVMKTIFELSFAGMIALLAVFSYVKDTVKTEADISQKLDTSLFSTVYHEKPYRHAVEWLTRKKKMLLLSEPSVSFLYEETIKKVGTKLLYKMKSEHAKVVLVTSTMEGEGKSTIAMNLAQEMSRRGKKVLLIDGDLRKPGLINVMNLQKMKKMVGWGQTLKEKGNLMEAALKPRHFGFQVLLNNASFPQATELLGTPYMDSWMQKFREEMDVVIIDAPPVRRRSDTEVLARWCDMSLLVVRRNQVEAKYINDSIDMLEGYGSGLQGCIYNDAIKERDFVSQGYGYGYGYGRSYGYGYDYSHYGRYGKYDKH